ncbi:hypothetical protein TPHA_0L01620 [Tetrapisispora phaffii CBS 4417]|uniref:Uncharacterized protein n=1 Tax=Tetrapisispora phaffii (strain ATCC 24235 / CBS 4417 / NBRC 1672 / NRRL Y-8282 / UCD 70-5) TaxID=1071381 RepID=G8C037_TETPH|nr:hypothetical protein TPHA_0L01620 [Tetrapisispora phaffii CBS 4417]CCE65515.1 hypothetical protein TPHA_0L01620 [Tetrapisispora phaffii CBS 4417]
MTSGQKSITWQEVKRIVSSMELYHLVRTRAMSEVYRKYREDIKAKGLNFGEILLLKLNWTQDELNYLNDDKYPADNDKIDAAFSNADLYTLRLNDFPYNFESDVHHILIWSKVKLPLYEEDFTESAADKTKIQLPSMNKHMQQKIETFLQINVAGKFGIPKENYVWFVNYSKLQSVRSISHIHLLLKKDDDLITAKIFEENFDPLV